MHSRFRTPKNKVSLGLNEPDYICFIGYAAWTVAEAYRRSPDVDRVNFVVSKKEKVTHWIGHFFEDMKLFLHPPRAPLLGKVIPASMEVELPLQAADLLCWHMQRYHAGTMDRMDEGRLALLTLDTDGHRYSMSRGNLKSMARALARRAGHKLYIVI